MPHCGTQMTICDLPIRFDTYKGCLSRLQILFRPKEKSIARVTVGRESERCGIYRGNGP